MAIDFGTLYTNYGGSVDIAIGNNGTDVLEITSMAVDNDVFSLSSSTTTVAYDDEFILTVTFSPTTDGDYSGAITILSNDLDEPEITIGLTATATSPPIVSVAPASLSSNLLTGETRLISYHFYIAEFERSLFYCKHNQC